MEKFPDFIGTSNSSLRNVRLPSSASAPKEDSSVVIYKEIADKSGISIGAGSLEKKSSSGRSRETVLTQRDSRTGEPDHVNQRKAKLKRFLRKESTSTTSSVESGYRQLVDFSSFQAVGPSKDDANIGMFDRTSMTSAGVIEFSPSFEEREMKRDRMEEEMRRRKKDKAMADFIVRPMRINLKPYQIEELKEAFNMLENGMELIDIIHVPTIVRACGFEPDHEEVKEILDEIKPVNEGFLNLQELIQVFEAKLKRKDPLEEIRRAFKVFDYNNTGMITLENLKEISKCVGEELHEEEMKEMINAADKTHSGGVTMENFVKLITRKEYFD